MTAQLGIILLLLAFLSAVYAWAAALIGARRGDAPRSNARLVSSARNAAIITFPLLTSAALTLIGLLSRGDFQVEYVWRVTERAMPGYLRVTALWGGQAGSMLFWSWLMSAFACAVMFRNWGRERALMPTVIAVTMGTLAFFLLMVTFWENPFVRYWQNPQGELALGLFGPSALLAGITASLANLGERLPGLLGVVMSGIVPFAPPPGSIALHPPDGNGLNPLLRHFGMIIHPPMLYLGFVSFVVPYAFGMAALVKGEVSDAWIRATRRWTLIAWLFLSLGLILGGRWAYDVLGWGGYWGWDPVENAALMPWLTGTAFLHSVMIQEKRGMLRRWNMILITATYLQVLVGTFLTRSGVLSSVHSFAQSAIGPIFLVAVITAFVSSTYWLIKRWDALKADTPLDSLLSRESAFLLNNFLFVSINIAVAVGTFWPLITELLAARIPGVEKASVGPQYYNQVTGPLWLGLVFLMGLAPLIAWKRASAMRLGKAMLIPIGVALLLTVLVYGVFGVHNGVALTGYGIAFLTGIITLLEYHRGARARTHALGESYPRALWSLIGRNRRRYGGYMIHLGVVVMAIGVVSSYLLQSETQRAVAAGQTITLGKYVMEYENLERYIATDGREVIRANVVVYQDGREIARLRPRIDTYASGERMTIPGVKSTLAGDDFYIRLVSWEPVSLSEATFKVYHNPLINWVWGGGFIFIFGTLIAAWPDFAEERRTLTDPALSAVSVAGK